MSKVKIQGNASGTGVLTIEAPNTNTDRTITLPDSTGTLVGADANGNVGIGTSSPSAKLDVAGEAQADTFLVKTGGDVEFDFNGLNAHFTGGNSPHIFAGQGSSGAYLAGTLNFQTRQTITRNFNFITGTSPAIRASITDNGITFNGDTASANALDDYEEGVHEFTAVGSTSGSWTPRTGWHRMAYTKIGRQVTVTGQIEVQGLSSPVGICHISLPFAIGSTDARFSARTSAGDLRGQGQSTSGHINVDARHSNSYIRLFQVTDAGSATYLDNNTLDSAWEFNLCLTYFTD